MALQRLGGGRRAAERLFKDRVGCSVARRVLALITLFVSAEEGPFESGRAAERTT
jgi:hypothetical protein